MGEIPFLGSCPIEAMMAQREVLLLCGMCSRIQDGDHKGEVSSLGKGKRIGLVKGMVQHKP